MKIFDSRKGGFLSITLPVKPLKSEAVTFDTPKI
jgi:hypothetical protein